ncbi:hypothetical protein ACFOWB_08090 [Chenggangzhangella methanolivorans]|uniref:hypothetical protein n=1 Tax=Chenggangzhangella methanolivorans TaxID=1437009 RepID=UPI003612F807
MLNSDNDLVRILSRSAVAGVGFSAGRDFYKGMKNNAFLIVAALVLLVAPFMLARMVTQGHDAREGQKSTLPAIGLGAIFLLLIYFLITGGYGERNPATGSTDNSGTIALVLLMISSLAAALGTLMGLSERPKRLRGFRIAADNERFLQDNGIRNLGGESQALRDAAGTEMVIDERRDNEIVLKVVGRRMKRAFLTHDDEGRFIQYIPAEGL